MSLVLAGLVLIAANYGYGLVHEAAHGAVIGALGGQVYRIYVDPAGLDAYIEHSPITGVADTVLLNLAGLGATTALAFALLALGSRLTPVFLAGRTAIYAINYGPGTDISVISSVIGQLSLVISVLVVIVNLACIYVALKGHVARPLWAKSRQVNEPDPSSS